MASVYLALPSINGEEFLINTNNIGAIVPYTANGRPMARVITMTGNEYIINMTCEEFRNCLARG